MAPLPPIKIGISACLLGYPVRYNGGHKASALCLEVLSQHFKLSPVCPEEAIGLGTPRQPIRLIGDPASPRALGTLDLSLDVTDALNAFGRRTAERMHDVCGYVLMQKSPSCGLQGVKVYLDHGSTETSNGRGLFAAALTQAHPDLPVEEERDLANSVVLESFISRVHAYADWQQMQRQGLTQSRLLQFHQRYTEQLQTHDPKQYHLLDRALADSASTPLSEFAPGYFKQLMRALKQPGRLA